VSFIGLNYEVPLHALIADAIREQLLTAVEIIPDLYAFRRVRELRDMLRGFGVPYAFHFISNSLGSADFDRNNDLEVFAKLMQGLDPLHYSDHLTCCRSGDIDLMQNIAVPRTRDMVELFVDNIRLMKQRLGRGTPFLIENLTCGIDYEASTLDPAEFYTAIGVESDSDFLLDVHNLYVDELNRGFDAAAFIDRVPAERIREVHLAGGSWTPRRSYTDSHDAKTPSRVLELLDRVLARATPQLVLLERRSTEHHVPADEILADLADINRIHQPWTKRPERVSVPSSLPA
jgi:hypothetical protein